MLKRIFVLITALSGCQGISYDLGSVELAARGDDGRADVATTDSGDPSDAADAAAPSDMSTLDADVRDVGDAGGDMSDMFVSACEIPQPVDPARCNPTVTGVCPLDGFCALAVAGVPPPELLCVQRESEGTALVGETCERAFDCQEGTTCVDWGLEADPRPKSCGRYCEIETNKGCGDGEFCSTAASQPPLDGIGWCVPECDPYDANACPSGQTCNVDYNFPAGSCTPRFRCLTVEGSGAEGDGCGAGRAIASCAEDLVCYEVAATDFRCVKACQSEADCMAATCQPPSGPWNLRFCQ